MPLETGSDVDRAEPGGEPGTTYSCAMSVLAGLDAIFDRHLGVEDIGASSPHHRYRTSALRLSAGRPVGFNAEQLLREAYARLLLNLESSPRFARSRASQENWRFQKQLGTLRTTQAPKSHLSEQSRGQWETTGAIRCQRPPDSGMRSPTSAAQ